MPTRRNFLSGGIASLGLSAAAISSAPKAQAQPAKTRIDVHHHFVPPFHADVMAVRRSGGRPPKWTAQMSLEDMDKSGIATSIVSLVQPATWFADDVPLSRKLGRECNEYAAKMVQDHPGRFGQFATISPPDTEGSLKEIEYALDTLKADGIGVLSSYEGKYLGNPAYDPLWQELNRRRAVVYCHPYCAACGVQTTLTDAQNRGVEFVFDTTRTILSLMQTGAVARFSDIRFIWSHGGGTVPYITSRLQGAGQKLPKGVTYELQKFYYDTAQAFNPYTLPSFKKFVPTSQILFGTDFPLGGGAAATVAKGLRDNGGFTEAELRAIERDNALALLPRLART